ncbi:MAG: hypothetical protein ACOCWJ_06470 [Verrucomicrobiota bacterium]
MKIIYEPKGRAREYAPLACNLFWGCPHGCRYCYAPRTLRKDPAQFHDPEWVHIRDHSNIALRWDAKEILAHSEVASRCPECLGTGVEDVDGYRPIKCGHCSFGFIAATSAPGPVLLCFGCDPYPRGRPDLWGHTQQAITILRDNGVPVRVLTKNPMATLSHLDLYRARDVELGVSLSFIDDGPRAEWEPNAAPVEERIAVLRAAHALGIRTWVSVEPVIDPDEAYGVLWQVCGEGIANHIALGKWNRDKRAKSIDWPHFLRHAHERLQIAYHKQVPGGFSFRIKEDLWAHAPEVDQWTGDEPQTMGEW